MGQADVFEILSQSKKPLSLREITEQLKKADSSSVTISINRLLRYDEIKFKEIGKDEALKKYKSKRRMRLYYI